MIYPHPLPFFKNPGLDTDNIHMYLLTSSKPPPHRFDRCRWGYPSPHRLRPHVASKSYSGVIHIHRQALCFTKISVIVMLAHLLSFV